MTYKQDSRELFVADTDNCRLSGSKGNAAIKVDRQFLFLTIWERSHD